ncbi:MAG: hypothetical protein WCK93_06840 [Nitrosomonadales bacterium]
MQLRKLGCALFVMLASTSASALSLGEGQISSRIGEPFSARVALIGEYSRDVSFSQVKTAECRASIIGSSPNGCESLYEAKLNFSVKRQSDGQYYLKITGGRGDELFYRLLVKTTSSAGGTVYNSFEFLPEFGVSPDVPSIVEMDAGLSPGQYGVVGGKVIETGAQEIEVVKPVKATKVVPVKEKPQVVKLPAEITPVATSPKPVENRLQIKKIGEYADDIHALQKENGEIEAQIVLLEKHIGLLKEVIRLKSQAGTLPVSAVPAVVSVEAPQASANLPGVLTWILLAVVGILAAAIIWMFRKMKQLSLSAVVAPVRAETITPASLNVRNSLDLTGAFIKPKW